jgi:hypothetical protein
LAVHPRAPEFGTRQHTWPGGLLPPGYMQSAAVMMTRTLIIQRCTRVKFTRFHCTSADFPFSFCGSVAASRQRPRHHEQVLAKNKERRHGHRPRHTRIIQRCTRVEFTLFHCLPAELSSSCCESVAAAATTWIPRLSTCVNNKRCRGHRPRHHEPVPATHNGRRRGQLPGRGSTTCAAPRETAKRNDKVLSAHNERRRGQRWGTTIN